MQYVQVNAVTIIMAGILAAGLLFYIIPSSGLGRLYRQSREPGQMKSRYLKNMTKRFETAYALRQGVPNVEVFVRKYGRIWAASASFQLCLEVSVQGYGSCFTVSQGRLCTM